MNKILSKLSILIYTAYSQSCGNTHSVSTYISFSIHGPSVNDLIGADAFNTVVKDASSAFMQSSSSQKVAVRAFGGIVQGADSTELLGLTAGDATDVTAAIDGMSVNYALNYGNVVANAITNANSALEGDLEDKSIMLYSLQLLTHKQ